ncbi:BMP family protein [Thioclava sp. GXIMD2076]|uniref:putative B6 ABC transporter substrate-binding protein n=1 Tax=Thioclava sp. GXIMD2076 TaxID=3131931 RepID=UPI0030D57626
MIPRRVFLTAGSFAFVSLLPLAGWAEDIKTIAIVTPEQGTDFGWNQQGVEGLQAAAEAAGIEPIVAQGLGYGNIRPTLRELADDGAQLIVAHASGYSTEAVEVAKEMKVMVAAANIQSEPPYVANYTLMAEKGAFLAGVLAAKTTKTGKIGIVVSSESPNWNAQSAGFAQGVRYVSKDIELRYAIIGPAAYADVAGARRVTESVIASGADIIFGQGNGSSFGMIQAVETTTAPGSDKTWFIDVIGDKTSLDKGNLLSSVIWDMSPIFGDMIKDANDGNFGKSSYALRLEDNSQRLMKTSHIPDDVWAQIEAVKAKIIDGSVKVDLVTDPEATKALMSSTLSAAN